MRCNKMSGKAWAVGTVTLIFFVVSGCSGIGSKDTPKAGPKSVTVAQGVDPTTMDPLQQRETTTVNVLQHFYDPLVRRDSSDPTKIDGILAVSWKRVNDVNFTLKLRDNVKFADGSAFSSADVKYTFEYLLGKLPKRDPAIASYQFTTIDSVTAPDPLTVNIKTKQADPLLLDRLTQLYIVKKGSVDKDENALAATPNGTGPYDFVKWDRNNQVVMKAKKNYFLGAPTIENGTFKTITEASSRLAALQAGDVDIITNVPADNVAEIDGSKSAKVMSVPSARIASVWFNTLKEGPLKNPQVRQALNHAVDVDKIIEQVMGGHGTRVATFVPPYFADYDPEIKALKYDPALAKKLLKEAGYGQGFEIQIMVPQGRYPFASEVTQAMAAYYAKVGVKMKINSVDFGVFAKATQERKIGDGFYGAWGNAMFNPLDELNVAVISGDKGFSWYSNKVVDSLTAQAGQTLDANRQRELISEIQHKLLVDPPFAFLFAYEDLYGVSDRLNWKPRSDESINLYEASVKS